MLAKLCAVWLVLLTVVPFTAPFSTVDLVDLLPEGGVARTPSSTLPTTAIARALSRAVALPPRVGRQRVAMCRLRLSGLVAISLGAVRLPFDTSSSAVVRQSGLPVILRI